MKIATNFYSFSECSEFVLMIIPDSPELLLYKQKGLSNCMISPLSLLPGHALSPIA